MKITKDRVLYGLIIVLILLFIGDALLDRRRESKYLEQIREGNMMIVEMDQTMKEKDGQYTKLINNFNTEKELDRVARETMGDDYKELKSLLKRNDEKLLMMTSTILSLESQLAEGFGTFNDTDSSLIDLDLKYPNDDEWFITWNGSVHTKTAHYKGEWSFGELPLQIVMTETDRGLWRSRLIGPDWLIVDSIEVNSLTPENFQDPTQKDPREFGFQLGAGYIRSFDVNIPHGLSVGGGMYFKNHSLILNGTTNRAVGINYYYRF